MFAALLAASLLAQTSNHAAAATRPTLDITYPKAKHTVTNAAMTVSGKTKDKVAVTNVLYQLNGTGWLSAATTNGWTNWTADVTLAQGADSVEAYAVDQDGNYSHTNLVKFAYVPKAQLAVQVATLGTVTPGVVTPNYNGKWLDIDTNYTMTAKPDKGFAFVNWAWSGGSTNKPTLAFQMTPGLDFTASFQNVTPPVLAIRSPKTHHKFTDAALTVAGKSRDKVGVTNVTYQLNGTGWLPAVTTNVWTNWTAQVTLSAGSNYIQAYAQDTAGLPSKTNAVSVVYTVVAPELAPTSLSGMSAVATSSDGTETSTISFGASTFSQQGANEDDNTVGNYSYKKQSPDTAQLTVTATAPPEYTSSTVVGLTFTNTNQAVFSYTSKSGTVETGTAVFSQAPDLAPTSLAGLTLDLADTSTGEDSTAVFASSSLTLTNQTTGEVSVGPYTFKQYSPVGGLATIHFASISGHKNVLAYYITTFSASDAGTWLAELVASKGHETHFGTFTVP